MYLTTYQICGTEYKAGGDANILSNMNYTTVAVTTSLQVLLEPDFGVNLLANYFWEENQWNECNLCWKISVYRFRKDFPTVSIFFEVLTVLSCLIMTPSACPLASLWRRAAKCGEINPKEVVELVTDPNFVIECSHGELLSGLSTNEMSQVHVTCLLI